VTRSIPTAEMTLGPFFPREFGAGANDLTVTHGGKAKGEIIEIGGRVTQGDGAPLDNAILELWQASPEGRFDDPAFLGWCRAATDADGNYRFRTFRPGACPGRAPHVNLLIVFSGLMRQLQTVVFFEGEERNSTDPVFSCVEPAALRSRLIATGTGKIATDTGKSAYRFDIRLRGEGETPFFDD
jgi:protocatechuate 3,4-dioxygenase alpha subunit